MPGPEQSSAAGTIGDGMSHREGDSYRVVLDLQACQTRGSRGRGIGRYSRSFAHALLNSPGRYDLIPCVNSAFADSADELTREFEPLIAMGRIVRYDASRPPTSWSATAIDAGRVAGEWIAQHAWVGQKPDLVHISSVFEGMDGEAVVPDLLGMPRATVVSATAYDLIPMLFADIYLEERATRDWYRSRIDRLRRCDVLLAISEATRRDLIERLDIPADRIATIQGAADARFQPAEVSSERRQRFLGALGLSKPYVMYTGGIDHRKNVEATIRAFAQLPPEIRDAYQMAIVCSVSETDRLRLEGLTKSLGLPRDGVVLTGFVTEDDLVDLYRCCELFIFPSKYEGFGLPVLEAMSCGAPTIAADASSLPEIVGWRDALFPIHRDAQIAAALARALSDADFRGRLRSHATERAKHFSWQRVADRAREAWSEAIARKNRRVAVCVAAFKPRLAIVTPLLPQRSGIADFITELMPHLAKHFRIDLFASEGADHDRYRAMGFDVHSWQALPDMWLDYDAGVLYQFGNSEFHAHMLALLRSCPGTVFLHDAYLSGLIGYLEFGPPRIGGIFASMLAYSASEAAVADYQKNGVEAAIERYPMCRWVTDHATGVIVTSNHARALLARAGQIDGARCRVVQHQRSVQPVSPEEKARARDALSVPPSTLLVCSLGATDDRKLSMELVDAWCRRDMSRPSRLVFVGKVDGPYGETLRRRIQAVSGSADIRIAGYVSDEEFLQYVKASDVIVQLRKGSRGEASGAALYAMAHGVPLVTSRHGSLSEIPDSACIHLDEPIDTVEVASVLDELSASETKRAALGRRGSDWIREACDPQSAARAVSSAVFSFNDPVSVRRRALLREKISAFAEMISQPIRQEWLEHVEARAIQSEPSRLGDERAASIARALSAMSPTPWGVPDYRGRLLEPGHTVTLLATDHRLMTSCGRKAGAVLETTGHAGVLLYGPYLAVASGRYRLRLYGSCDAKNKRAAATLEVVSEAGNRVLRSCEIAASATIPMTGCVLARLDFAAHEAVTDLEVRVHVSSETEMTVESIDLVALGP